MSVHSVTYVFFDIGQCLFCLTPTTIDFALLRVFCLASFTPWPVIDTMTDHKNFVKAC